MHETFVFTRLEGDKLKLKPDSWTKCTTCEELNLSKLVYQISCDLKTPIVLEKNHHIAIGDDVKPVVVPVRKILYALKRKLKEEFQRMITLDILRAC